MATYLAYSMRVEGRLQGTVSDNGEAIRRFKAIFGEPKKSEWQADFVRPGLTVAHWSAEGTAGGKSGDETILSFFALQSAVLAGKMADSDNLLAVERFSSQTLAYRSAGWYLTLRHHLEEFNNSVKGSVIERVWFREQAEVKGDGGDM